MQPQSHSHGKFSVPDGKKVPQEVFSPLQDENSQPAVPIQIPPCTYPLEYEPGHREPVPVLQHFVGGHIGQQYHHSQQQSAPRQPQSYENWQEDVTVRAYFRALIVGTVPSKIGQHVAVKEERPRDCCRVATSHDPITEAEQEVGVVPQAYAVPGEGTVVVPVEHGTVANRAEVRPHWPPLCSGPGVRVDTFTSRGRGGESMSVVLFVGVIVTTTGTNTHDGRRLDGDAVGQELCLLKLHLPGAE